MVIAGSAAVFVEQETNVIRAKDATLAEIDGTWWMFVSIAEHSIPDELAPGAAVSVRDPLKAAQTK